MIERLLQTALCEIQAGRPAMLVSIVRSTGSTPRKAGALMLVGENGLLCGTIGGGLLEHRCLAIASSALTVPRCEAFVLDNRQAGSLGMVCGGTAEVLFTPLTDAAPLQQAVDSFRAVPPVRFCLPLDGSAPLLSQEQSIRSCPAVVLLEERPVLALPLSDTGRVFVLGGGHVSLALSRLLYHLEFRHIVIDDRAVFCSPERFPHAEHTLCIPFSLLTQTLAGPISPAADDAFCIMTRGHEGDTDALRFALSTPASYIGVMGSRRKRESVFSLLESEGFLHVRQRVITPIGLAIGAQTPAEIAVSIAAQLIAWRSSKTAAAKL